MVGCCSCVTNWFVFGGARPVFHQSNVCTTEQRRRLLEATAAQWRSAILQSHSDTSLLFKESECSVVPYWVDVPGRSRVPVLQVRVGSLGE